MLRQETKYLLTALEKLDTEKKADSTKPKVTGRSSVGFVSFVYEKARNLIDYQEEHLLLRRAIARILIRRSRFNRQPQDITQSTVTELLQTRYITENELSLDKVQKADAIVSKYVRLIDALGSLKIESRENPHDFLLTLCAREIEELFVPSAEDLIINFALKNFERRVSWLEFDNGNANARLLVGIMRALARFDERTIYYKLWKLYFPEWAQSGSLDLASIAVRFTSADQAISEIITEPVGEKVLLALKKHIAPFELLKDLVNRDFTEITATFADKDQLVKSAMDTAKSRYRRARSALKHSTLNSFIYVLITKMGFALALEIPYEAFIATQVSYLPIGLNLIIPPALMLLMALSVESPTDANFKKVTEDLAKIIYDQGEPSPIVITLGGRRSNLLYSFFVALYILIFVLVFGLTVYLLRLLHFSVLSIGIFFFFLSTIAFFSFRIRTSFRESVVGEDDSNFITSIFDFLMLPFVKLGRMVSTGLQSINIFVFIFDIIIEAPLKILLEILEAWIAFLREKKEEALNVIK